MNRCDSDRRETFCMDQFNDMAQNTLDSVLIKLVEEIWNFDG